MLERCDCDLCKDERPQVLECIKCGSRWLPDIIGKLCPSCGSNNTKPGSGLPQGVTKSIVTHRRLDK